MLAGALATTGIAGVVLGALGSITVCAAFAWHSWALRRAMGAAFVSPGAVTLRYHLAGGIIFIIGALVGLIMTIDVTSFELAQSWWPALYENHDAMALVHVFAMVLGFIGMTVLGTIVTFGPTVGRTRMSVQSLRWSGRALPVLISAIVVGAAASLAGLPVVAGIAAGVWVVAAIVGVLWPVFKTWRGSMLGVGDGWTIEAGLIWLVAGCAVWAFQLALAPDAQVARSVSGGTYAIFFAAGALQLILGSLTYLLPVVAGGGPAMLRQSIEFLERTGALRFFVLNGAMVLALTPFPLHVHNALLGAAGLTAFMSFVLVLMAVVRQKRPESKQSTATQPAAPRRGPRPMPDPHLKSGAAIAAALLLAVTAGGYGVQSIAGTGISAGTSDNQNAPVTEVDVTVSGMAFVPSQIEVPAGNRLIVNFENTGDQRHDLVFDNGAETGPVPTGETATVDAGIIEESTEGWCSMVGHRQMGMTLDVIATGTVPLARF